MKLTRAFLSPTLLVLAGLASLASACGDSDDESSSETGGRPATGGRSSTGGRASGGAPATGGVPAATGGLIGDAGGESGGAGESAAGANGGGGSPSNEPEAGGAGEGGSGGSTDMEGEARLLIADADAATLYVYAVPSLEQLAVFEDVSFAEHPGFLPLNDGRVLFTDAATEDLVALEVLGESPRIVGRAHLERPPIHLAVDPAQQYAAVSGAGLDEESPGEFTLVRLSDFFHKSVPIPTGEPGVLMGGDPLYLYHRNDAPPRIEAYRFEDLWAGTIELAGSADIGTGPHGEAIAHADGKIFVAADDGINVMSVDGTTFGDVTAIPYDVDGKTGGRAFYARLSFDGKYLYSYLRDSGPDFSWPWKDWVSDAYIVDVENETAKRLEVGNGLVYRLADSKKYAMFVQYHPDGDAAYFLDTDPSSDTFQEMVATVPLERMTKAPTGDDADPWSSVAFRLTGMVPSGRWAFVSHGGDGKVSVIDTDTMEVTAQIELPTPLNYGGYLLGVEAGAVVRDTVGR